MKYVIGQWVYAEVWSVRDEETHFVWGQVKKHNFQRKALYLWIPDPPAGIYPEWWVRENEKSCIKFNCGLVANQPKVGDLITAEVWPDERDDLSMLLASEIIEVGHDRLWVSIPKEGQATFRSNTWEICYSVHDPNLLQFSHGFLVNFKAVTKPAMVKKVWSPLMNDPYGKGPEGETQGPSGLSFL